MGDDKTGALVRHMWGAEIASPISMNGVVKAVTGEPTPLPLTQPAKLNRPQQLLFMHRFLHMSLVPSYVGDPQNQGGLALERVLASVQGLHWWGALTGQFRIQKLLSVQQGKISGNSQQSAGSEQSNPFKCFLNKSLYALGLSSRIWSGRQTSLMASSDLSSNKKECRTRAVLHHKFQHHDVSMEASWHERIVKTQGSSWNAPLSIALDLASLGSTSGLRYRLGIHHNSGLPHECGKRASTKIPWVVLPGLCAKAAVSIEKHAKLWKDQSDEEMDLKPYHFYLRRPHVTVSAITGSTFSAILAGDAARFKAGMLPMENEVNENDKSNSSSQAKVQRSPFSADLFASLGCIAQLGKFRRPLLDLTRLEARLDIGTASAFATGASELLNRFYKSSSYIHHRDEKACPTLAIVLQQQIAGPVCARIDSRFSLDCSSSKSGIHVKEFVYGLDYSLKVLGAAKVFAWYSPTRQEGMVELRFLEK